MIRCTTNSQVGELAEGHRDAVLHDEGEFFQLFLH